MLEYNTQVLAIEMTGRKPWCIRVQMTAVTSIFYFMLVLCVLYSKTINPILPGGGGVKYAPLLFFLHHPKTAQGIKLKLCDFKDTLLRHILQVKPVR